MMEHTPATYTYFSVQLKDVHQKKNQVLAKKQFTLQQSLSYLNWNGQKL